MAFKPVSVSQLNSYIKRLLANDPILGNIGVRGELSGFTRHSSGHCYFSLKDESSRINCFLPQDRVQRLRFELSEGMEIIAYGSVSVFERNGSYSLYVRDIDVEGEGELKKAYENLKNKLAKEGLFDESHKRPIPERVRNIGVVTSPTGAAIRDIITTVKRRSPLVNVLLCPCLVQGEGAADSIVAAIKILNERFPTLDLIIAGRGGGSAEDLWCFNEEAVVRAVYASRIPIISAVGHETDNVLSDLAADLRGSTPTAAAELAVSEFSLEISRLASLAPQKLYGFIADMEEDARARVRRNLEYATQSLDSILLKAAHALSLLKLEADGANPLRLIGGGYAMVSDRFGKRLESACDASPGDSIKVMLKDGSLICRVEERLLEDEE
ncbi:MAG TPA: exodeoxyribonuclease VII large subunit [Bacillota bacterium]|nr:exodeoxyribonuclease VII large subunit [Bacillota bacterium]